MEEDLVNRALAGNRLALARLITQIENNTDQGIAALDRLFPLTGKAHLIGITGPTGSGKSTLVNRLAYEFRHPGKDHTASRVGIVAVDPSSPFTGGALLGDRVRMRDLAGDPGVFIRSMSARGALGGLARSTAAVVQVLDACGYDKIIIETVGTGQSEVDIARLAHTTIVVQSPRMGDDIQALKAGILEIADILVINKADLSGAEQAESSLRMMLNLKEEAHEADIAWHIPIARTSATKGEGISGLFSMIQDHNKHLWQSGEWQQREQARLRDILENLIGFELIKRWYVNCSREQYDIIFNHLCLRQISPHQAVEKLLE